MFIEHIFVFNNWYKYFSQPIVHSFKTAFSRAIREKNAVHNGPHSFHHIYLHTLKVNDYFINQINIYFIDFMKIYWKTLSSPSHFFPSTETNNLPDVNWNQDYHVDICMIIHLIACDNSGLHLTDADKKYYAFSQIVEIYSCPYRKATESCKHTSQCAKYSVSKTFACVKAWRPFLVRAGAHYIF